MEVSNSIIGIAVTLECLGHFDVEPREVPHRNRFSQLGTRCGPYPARLETASFADYSLSLCVFVLRGFSTITNMATFNSVISFTAEQLAAAPPLEAAFEHLLRNSMTHESVINALRVNEVTDHDTFVNMFDSGTALKEVRQISGSTWLQEAPHT